MNVQEYIESGILEQYVLQQLTPVEQLEVERIRAMHPEVDVEINRIEETLFQYANLHSKPISEKLKSNVLNKINQLNTTVHNQKPISIWVRYSIAASFLLAMLAISYLYIDNTQLHNKLVDSQKSLNSSQENLTSVITQLEAIKEDYSIASGAEFRKIIMNSLDTLKTVSAIIYWNQASNDVYLNTQSLPELTADLQYQLWFIKDGKPIDSGIFDHKSKLLKMAKAMNPQSFAITVEKRGGSPTPTLTSMVVLGKL